MLPVHHPFETGLGSMHTAACDRHQLPIQSLDRAPARSWTSDRQRGKACAGDIACSSTGFLLAEPRGRGGWAVGVGGGFRTPKPLWA